VLAELTIDNLVTDDLLNRAFTWLCQRRKDWPSDADVWRFRQDWPHEKARLHEDLLAGTYQVGVLDRVALCRNGEQEEIYLWPARDALVMKALAWLLEECLPLSPCCRHLKGHGGQKGAVRQVLEALPQHQFVLKTDIQAYYASIDHQRLLDRLAIYIADQRVLHLITQYLRRCAERGGLYWEHRQGIALGCPLSPIIGAFYLNELDEAFEGTGLFYARFMDDILVLAPTRWKLRKAVKVVNEVLALLRLRKHPDKTFIGHISKGFDFLGYAFRPGSLTVAKKTLTQFISRTRQLYEQGREVGDFTSRLDAYVQRWARWVIAGLPERFSGGFISCCPIGICHLFAQLQI
jgi:RNA-directed DNA polymerase